MRWNKRSSGIWNGFLNLYPENAQALGRRHEQQDAFGFSDLRDEKLVKKAGVLAVLADGMGGMAYGQEAAVKAVDVLLKAFKLQQDGELPEDWLMSSFEAANYEVWCLSVEKGISWQMGTTLAAAIIREDKLYWASAGDTRIYRYHEGILTQLTEDHHYLTELIKQVQQGTLTLEEAKEHPEKDYLTSYVGMDTLGAVCISSVPIVLEKGDKILLCSDGLYNSLYAEEMIKILRGKEGTAAEKLIEEAMSRQINSQDNLTCLIIYCV